MTPAEEQPADISRRERLARARMMVQGALTRPESLIPFLIKRVAEARITRSAAALSFSTALAVVPALALILATLAAFPAFNNLRTSLQNAIVANLVPDTGMKISEFMTRFIEAAGKLTAFGVIGLVATAILLLLTIEGALNEILKVTKPRLLRQRLLVFWAVMTIGPVLLGAGLSSFGYFTGKRLVGGAAAEALSVLILLGNLMPTLITWATLTLLYLLLPHRRVKIRDALAGAAVAAVLLAILRYTFTLYVFFMTSYQAIYGALAAFPVFLVWIYLVWLAVLAGAVVTSALPDWRHTRAGVGAGTLGRLVLALDILARLAAARRSGLGLTADQMAKVFATPDTLLMTVLGDLRSGRFVAPTEGGRWMLARDLERVPLADLVHHFGLGMDVDLQTDDPRTGELGKRLNHHLRSAAESERSLLSISLARIVAVPEEPKAETKEAVP